MRFPYCDKLCFVANNRIDDSFDLLTIQEVLRGETEAFERIVRKYRRQLLYLALSYLGQPEAAEDAVQEIFVKVYHSLSKFSLQKRFHPWLYAIAVNHLKNLHRKKTRKAVPVPDLLSLPDEKSLTPGEILERKEEILRVRKAVISLPAKLREPFILYYYFEMNVHEIAETLGIGAENVKSRLFRGRKKMRGYLTE